MTSIVFTALQSAVYLEKDINRRNDSLCPLRMNGFVFDYNAHKIRKGSLAVLYSVLHVNGNTTLDPNMYELEVPL